MFIRVYFGFAIAYVFQKILARNGQPDKNKVKQLKLRYITVEQLKLYRTNND